MGSSLPSDGPKDAKMKDAKAPPQNQPSTSNIYLSQIIKAIPVNSEIGHRWLGSNVFNTI